MSASRILIADDDEAILDVLRINLEAEGFIVESATNGMEALSRALASPPDLLILDGLMPGINGWEICRLLRGHQRTKAIPVLLLTVRSSPQEKLLALQNGATDYLTKPFEPEKLIERVKIHLSRGAR